MSATTNNTPSTEGKAPDTAVTNTTSTTATSTATTSTVTSGMTPVIKTQTSTPENNTQGAETAAPAQNAAASLPADYLKGGYFRGEGKGRYTDPALIDHAAAIAKALAQSGVPANAVKKMARTLKTAARLPYEAQKGALKKLTPLVLDLEHKKKAPALLREVVERNQAAVENGADFAACLDHFRDIAIFLQAAQG